jgi:hypothetical protein
MAASGPRALCLTLAAATVAAAGGLAAVLARLPGDWRPGLVVLGAAGVVLWARGVLRGRADQIAAGVGVLGAQALLALAAVRHPGAGVPLLGPALLVAAEAAFLSVELRPLRRGVEAALADRALRIGAVALGGWLAGVLVLGAGDAASGADTLLDVVAGMAAAGLAAGVLLALRGASKAG